MAKYVLAYHGGAAPESEEEGKKVMEAWMGWMGSLGDALIDGGNATGAAKTVVAGGTVEDGGGPNPISGYSLLEAADLDAAVALVKDCPIFDAGGSVEVAETIDM